MFKPIPMQYISLNVLTEDVPLAAQILADTKLFNPETNETLAQQLPERLGEEFHNVFNSARGRLEKILSRISFIPPIDIEPYRVVELVELKDINTQLGTLWSQFSKQEEQLHQLNEQQTALKQLLETLQKFTALDLDLKLFQEPKRFLNLHIGTIPLNNLEHLKEAIALAKHFINIFHRDEQTAYFVVAGPLEHEEQVQAVLEHADFQPLNIPPEFHNHPQQVHAELIAQLKQQQEQIEALTTINQELVNNHQIFLEQAYTLLNRAADYALLATIN